MNMKGLNNIIIVLMLSVVTVLSVKADDCGDLPPCHYADDVPGITCCELVEAPFDGGITLMLAAGGIGMGVRAIRKKKKAV